MSEPTRRQWYFGEHTITYNLKYEKGVKIAAKWIITVLITFFFYYCYLLVLENKGFEFAAITILYFILVTVGMVSTKIVELKKVIENGRPSN